MPVTVQHSRTATTPDNTTAEIRPSHWNEAHVVSVSLAGSEVIKYIGASGSSISSGTLSFSNSNGITFGMSGGTITASHAGLTTQSVQTQGIQSLIAGGNTVTGGGVVFSNANSISFGIAGSTVTASISQSAQTNQSIGLYASSQTTGAASATTVDARSLSVVGAGGVSVGMSAGLLVVSGAAGGAADGFNRLAAGTQTAGTNTTVQFADSNGITFGMSGSNQITASHNALTSQSAQAFSAPNGSSTFQTIAFADSNGVSWSNSNGSIVASVATAGGGANSVTQYAVGNTTGDSSSATQPLSSFQVRGLGIASIGYSSDGALIVSVPAGGGVGDGANFLAAGTQTATSLGSVAFVDSNGITFGMSGSTRITASHNGLTTAALSNHSHGNPTLALTNLTGTTASASNGLTLSLSAAAPQTAASMYAVSNTTQSSSMTAALSALSFHGAGAASVGASNGSVVISVAAGAAGGIALSAGTQEATSGTVLFSNTNNITFGMSNSSRITALAAINIYVHGNSTNTSSGLRSLPNVTIDAMGGMTAGFSAGSLQLSAPGGVQLYASSQTTGQSSSSSAHFSSLTVRGAGGVSVGMSAGELVISGGAGGGVTPVVSANNGSYSFTTLSLSNANGVSFGTSAGSAITASVAAQTNQTGGIYAVGNTTGQSSSSTYDARTLSIDVAGIVSAGWSNGTLRVSATQSNQAFSAQGGSSAFQTLGFSNANGATFTNTNGSIGLSYTVPSQVSAFAQSNTTQSSSGTIPFSSLQFAGAGAASVGISNGSIIISSPTPGAATITVSAVGNTTVNSSGTWPGAVSMRGYGILSIGTSNGSLLFSTPDAVDFTQMSVGNSNLGNTAGDTGVFTGRVVLVGSNNITLSGSSNAGSATLSIIGGAGGGGAAISAGTQSVSTGTVVFSNSNNLTFGMSGSSRITMSGALNLYALGNTTQNSSTVLGLAAISLNGLGALTAGYSNGSIQLSAPATSSLSATGILSISSNGSTISIGVPGGTASFWSPYDDAQTTASQVGNGSVFVQPAFNVHGHVSLSRFDVLASVSVSSSTNSSHAGALSLYIGMYTRNGSTLSLASSGSQSYQWTNTSNNSMGSITGLRRFSVPLSANIVEGNNMWIALLSRSSTTNANWITASNARVSIATNPIAGLIGEASNQTWQLAPGFGLWSTTSAALPASIAIGDIRGIGSGVANNALPFFVNANNFTA